MLFTHLPESNHPEVALRPIAAGDLPAWYAYLTTPQVYEHTSWNLGPIADLDAYVWSAETRTPASMTRFAIVARADDHLVGTIGFHTVQPDNRTAEIAYDLSPAVWRRGIATSMCRVVVSWAHSHVGLRRVQAAVLQSNDRSVRVLERCSFEREGLLRHYRMVRGVPGNFFVYSHLS